VRGDHAVHCCRAAAPDRGERCYRRTRQFVRQYLSKPDVATTMIEPADPKQLADAIRPRRGSSCQSPTNPYLRVIDVAEAARVAHARGVGS
jgi:cystathionine beta-lyase/cystathionine gamma-synthase